jgi:hypothetical protein
MTMQCCIVVLLLQAVVTVIMPTCPNEGCNYWPKDGRGLGPHWRNCTKLKLKFTVLPQLLVPQPASTTSLLDERSLKRVRPISDVETGDTGDLFLPEVHS